MSENIDKFAPESYQEGLLRSSKLALTYDPERNFDNWRVEVNRKFRELLGFDLFKKVIPRLRIEHSQNREYFKETRFVFSSEENVDVPCHLLVPLNGKAPYPLVICLQGHSTGMHISLGIPKFDGDADSIRGDRDFALQAVREGYAALVIEQRCFGERGDMRPKEKRGIGSTCHHASLVEILLGRTMAGARIWDVSKAIDMMKNFPEIDADRIGCMGNSGGGTITYYATCIDPRIKIAMPSCCFCTYEDSIGKIDHCADNYIPGILKYFEMADLSCLIPARPLIIVAGRKDNIFPFEHVKKAFEKVQVIYQKAGVPERCILVEGAEGHRFYAKEAWAEFRRLSGWSK
ncbi:MAG TPA: hypothetical protein DET40_19555 [Lentisphaeria bacterium]|nr:MAG: hypothetical protein A2X45_18385 [Lentisphaerae bacterium GWF2_50_93]HCE45745.1 hypothetical protein [Lentisphaeria bacterium]